MYFKKIYIIVLVAVLSSLYNLNAQIDVKDIMQLQEIQNQQSYPLRISIGGGYLFRIGNINTVDKTPKNIESKLRNGYCLNTDIKYFLRPNWGITLNGNFYKNVTDGLNFDIPSIGHVNGFMESHSILFIGLGIASRKEYHKYRIFSSISLGPMFFRNKYQINDDITDNKKTTFGIDGAISGEYIITKNIAIGAKIGYIVGRISSDRFDNPIIKDNKVNLSGLYVSLFASLM